MPKLLLFLLALPAFITAGPVSSPEISNKVAKNNNIQQQQQLQQQQHQQNNYNKGNSPQDPHLNQLSVYATNYDMISNSQNSNNHNSNNHNDESFKPSYKIPEMETNFTPIQNANSIAPDYNNQGGAPTPVLMQYLPQTFSGEGGIQYLQLIPTRPLIVPISPYLAGNNAAQTVTYHQTIAAPNNIEYVARPTALLNPMPVNMPPPAPTSLMEVSAPPMAAYGIQSYSPHIQQNMPYKQNYRINRETKDKQILGPLNLSLNLNEYVPGPQAQQGHLLQIRGRP